MRSQITGQRQFLAAGLVLLALGAGPLGSAPPDPHRVVATVNGENITQAQLQPFLEQTGPLPADLPDSSRRQLLRESLSVLIDDLLLAQFLRREVPPPSEAELKQEIKTLEEQLKARGQTLEEFCRTTRQTEAQLKASISGLRQWSAYIKNRIPEAEVRKFFDENREHFERVMVRASHIALRLPPNAAEYQRQEAEKRLRQLRAEIVAGKISFADAARQHSQCPTAQNGGDIGSFPRKYVVNEAFARAAFALKPGTVSEIVATDFGLHLILVTQRKAGQPTQYEKVREEVRGVYVEELRQTLLDRLRREAKIKIHLP